MELIYREMPLDYEFFDMSDLHYGPLNHHREAVLEVIEMVRKKRNRFLWVKGDAVDAIDPSDKRFASVSVEIRNGWRNAQDHADQVIKDFEPVRKKILAWLIGNHEYKMINTFNIGTHICKQLRVPYGGVICKFGATHKGEVQHKFLLLHGNGSLPHGAKDPIQREANRKAALKRKLDKLGHTDCIYKSLGHNHQLLFVEPTIHNELMLTDDGKRLHQQYRYAVPQDSAYIPNDCCWYGSSGSFLKLYSDPGIGAIGYGEIAGYEPAEIGCLKGTVQGGQLVNIEKVVL